MFPLCHFVADKTLKKNIIGRETDKVKFQLNEEAKKTNIRFFTKNKDSSSYVENKSQESERYFLSEKANTLNCTISNP